MKATSVANDLLALSLSNKEMVVLFARNSMLRKIVDANPDLQGELVLLTPVGDSKEDGWLVYVFDGLFRKVAEATPTHILETAVQQHCYRHIDPPVTGLAGVFVTT